jgi:alpha-mannosidase
VRIWAFGRFTPEAALITPSLEARNPLLAAAATGSAGPLPAARPGIELSRPGIALTAFGPNPDGAGWVLRLWEQAGRAGPCQVRLPAGMDASFVQPVNLRGEPSGAVIPVKRGSFSVGLGRFAPASFVVPKAP